MYMQTCVCKRVTGTFSKTTYEISADFIMCARLPLEKTWSVIGWIRWLASQRSFVFASGHLCICGQGALMSAYVIGNSFPPWGCSYRSAEHETSMQTHMHMCNSETNQHLQSKFSKKETTIRKAIRMYNFTFPLCVHVPMCVYAHGLYIN